MSDSFLTRLIPPRFRRSGPVVTHVRLQGAIGIGSPLKPPIVAKAFDDVLKRAFSRRGIAAVALSINSPGGSAVQSAQIHTRIRALADKHRVPVYAFCEDVAASGGYWLACAGDEIYADTSSIVGSIGVISSGFGFVDSLAKLGIERRVHTAGENKAILDPFQPERKEDVARLLSLQSDVHEAFKDMVRRRRSGRIKGAEAELFSGAFWSGRQALDLGLVDGIGHLHDVLAVKFGPDVEIKTLAPATGWGLRRFGFGGRTSASAAAELPEALIAAIEVRAMWSRFGL